MGADTIIFDLDDTLIFETSNNKGSGGFDDDLKFVKLKGRDYYSVIRPFACEVIDMAHDLFDNVFLWTWNPYMREVVSALGWVDKFDRLIWYDDFKPESVQVERTKLVKDLSLVVDDPNSAIILEDKTGVIKQENRTLRVKPFAGLGNDDELIRAFLDLERFGVKLNIMHKDNLEEIRALTLDDRLPKFQTRLKDLVVEPVNGYEVAFTPEGVKLVDEAGRGILDCIGFNGDKIAEVPCRFRRDLICDSYKGKLYHVRFGRRDLAFKFYKRKKLARGQQILIEHGLDQLEAAHFINTNTRYYAPTPYFASADVFCMEYMPDMMTLDRFRKAFPDDAKKLHEPQTRALRALEKNIFTSDDNFYVDVEYFKKTGKIRIHPFDQKALMSGNEENRSSQYYQRRKYLDRKYQLGIYR